MIRETNRSTYDEGRALLGKQLVNQLVILIKTSQIHDPTNVALLQPAENLVKTLNGLFPGDANVSLNLEGDSLFLGDVKLKIDIDGFSNLMFMIDEMKKRKVGSVVFSPGISEFEMRKFCVLFGSFDSRLPEPLERFQRELEQAQLAHLEIEPLEETKEKEGLDELVQDNKQLAKKTYFDSLTAVSEVMESVKLRQAVSFRRAKRVVQSLIDQIMQDDSTLLGLTNLRCHDEYTYNHSVNVCILALAMGQRLGYTKQRLSELGMAALFHDLGKYHIPLEILNKPSELTEEEWAVMRRHPIYSVKELLRLKGIHELAIRVMIGAFEHHLNYDLSGYPKLAHKRNLSLLGRIVSIVDCYDALTSSRVYRRVAYTPDQSLQYMLGQSGKAFDPILMKIFVTAIGVYPIGTLVLLNTEEVGVVFSTSPNPDKGDRPKVKVVLDSSGNEADGPVLDLSETDESGRFRCEIVKTIDATQYNIDVAKYFCQQLWTTVSLTSEATR